MDRSTPHLLPRLVASLGLVLFALVGCGDEPTEEGAGNNSANPCGDACPVEQCLLGVCVAPNNNAPDADADAAPDVAPDAEPDAEPDADMSTDEPDVEDEPDADADADMGEEATPCTLDEECPAQQRCDVARQVCVAGCVADEDCGPASTRLLCDVEAGRCVVGACRETPQCGPGFYCDREVFPTVCAEGCDVGTCPRGEFCDLEQRVCVGGCQVDADCVDPGAWCQAETARCLPGCRLDSCDLGEECVEFEGQEGADPTRACLEAVCASDEACASEEYCGVEPTFGRQVCQPGCRVEPDSCGEGQRCDEGARVCRAVLPTECSEELPCPDGSRCDEGTCVLGCAADADCAERQRCDVSAEVCSCEASDQCAPGQVCHEGRCADECLGPQDCAGDGLVCDGQARVCLVGCDSDEGCDEAQGLVCDLGRQRCVSRPCDADEVCVEGQYCDLFEGRCAPGCRAGECGEGELTCDPTSRLCIPGCAIDEDCREGRFCNAGACQDGCRDDGDCALGEVCSQTVSEEGDVMRGCVVPPCGADADCRQGEYCDIDVELGVNVCAPGCRDDGESCVSGSTCDLASRTCTDIVCASDEACPEGWICDALGITAVCRPGCRDGALCAPGQSCVLDRAACSCEGDEDCAQGQVCARGVCEAGCVSNADCGEGGRCDVRSSRCILGCEISADCADPGLRCDAGACVPVACEADADCDDALYCDLTAPNGGACAPGCRDGGCPQGQVCRLSDRTCGEGCASDTDCEDAQFCDPQVRECRPGCRSDAACDSPQVCVEALVRGQPGRICAAPGCDTDAQCGSDEYCGVDPQTQRRACLTGCRVSPDSCPQAQRCDSLARRCVSAACDDDADCEADEICDAVDGGRECRAGCRQDADCAQAQVCEQGPLRCTCDLDADCAQGQRCDAGSCVEACSSDAQCANGEICDTSSGRCRDGCREDGDCGSGQVCLFGEFVCAGQRCRADLECPFGLYCDLESGDVPRCEEGCRVGGCLSGFFCDTERRACVQGCNRDDDCLAGFFCDAEQRECRFGCRNRADCFGLDCVELRGDQGEAQRLCLPPRCDRDDQCEDNEYCRPEPDLGLSLCTFGCRLDVNTCPPLLACNPQNRLCEEVRCADDAQCGLGKICEPFEGRAICQPGCRANEACVSGACDLNQLSCLCGVDEDCREGEVCSLGLCEPRCQSDEACGEGLACDLDTGRCFEPCLSDEACLALGQRCDPDTQRCAVVPCEADEACPVTAWCDLDQPEPVCDLGCRPGTCPDGAFCDTDTRLCLPGCEDDAACPQGQTCVAYIEEGAPARACVQTCEGDDVCEITEFCGPDPVLGADVCQVGCRLTPDACPQGLVCDPDARQCLGAACQNDAQCPQGQICRAEQGACDVGCRANAQCGSALCDVDASLCTCDDNSDCRQGQVCDGVFCIRACQQDNECPPGLSCEAGLCVQRCDDDAFEPNDSLVESSPLPALVANDLAMCFLDGFAFDAQDCYSAQLTPGPYEAALDFLHAQGDLNLEVYDPNLTLVGLGYSPQDGETVAFDAVAGEYTFCVIPAGFFFASTYDLRVERR